MDRAAVAGSTTAAMEAGDIGAAVGADSAAVAVAVAVAVDNKGAAAGSINSRSIRRSRFRSPRRARCAAGLSPHATPAS
jgi:hypothetical protein